MGRTIQSPDNIGSYEVRRFPAFRTPTVDTVHLGKKRHHTHFLLEVDVTEARTRIREHKEKTTERISFTGWVIACIGKAVIEHKEVHALRKGRKRLVVFDDVDVAIVVERSVEDPSHSSESLPMPYLLRRANEKTVREIHNEIRAVQQASLAPGGVQLGSRLDPRIEKAFTMLPQFLRKLLVWRRLLRNPFLAKKSMGTVVVTSVGSIGASGGYVWPIPIGIQPLIFGLGSIARKPGLVNDEIAVREYLSMTVLFDHDVTDGAPVVRFLECLKGLLERGHGLDEASADITNSN